jgi:indolepyruvate ferredoxin oxidoreductase beta subunit
LPEAIHPVSGLIGAIGREGRLMNETIHQQIVISGVGGQGVLFVTRLMAEAAIRKGLPVLTSETHGMAQRGGTVISHLKVGAYTSPLIRTGQADVLLAMKDEGAPSMATTCTVTDGRSSTAPRLPTGGGELDADGLAHQIGNPRAVNLVVLGGALAEGATPSPVLHSRRYSGGSWQSAWRPSPLYWRSHTRRWTRDCRPLPPDGIRRGQCRWFPLSIAAVNF